MEPLEDVTLVIIITYLFVGAVLAERIDVTFVDEELLSPNGRIYKYNAEAAELLNHFEQSFLAAGNSLLEPCDRDHHLRIEHMRNTQNSQINLLSLPIELGRLGTILNSTWSEIKKTPNFCKFHPFWRKEQIDLTCDERFGVCCSASQVKGRGGCVVGSHLRKDRYYWPTTTTTTLRSSTTALLTTTAMTTTVAIRTTTTSATTITKASTTTTPPQITSPAVTTATEVRTTTTHTRSSYPELHTNHSDNQPSAPESPVHQPTPKPPASVTTPVVNPLLLLIIIIFALIVVALLSICRYF